MKYIYLLLLIFSVNSFAHLRRNDIVNIKNKYSPKCLNENDIFNNCDKVDKFLVAEFYDYKDTYELRPIIEGDCRSVDILGKNVDYCLQKENK